MPRSTLRSKMHTSLLNIRFSNVHLNNLNILNINTEYFQYYIKWLNISSGLFKCNQI